MGVSGRCFKGGGFQVHQSPQQTAPFKKKGGESITPLKTF